MRTTDLELSSLPEPNLVLKTDLLESKRKCCCVHISSWLHLLFIYFYLIYYFLKNINWKFKRLFSRLHQNILGQNSDVRCLCSSADHLVFSDSVTIPLGSLAHQALWGVNQGQPGLDQFHPEEKEEASLATKLGEAELGYWSVQDRRHWHYLAPFPASFPALVLISCFRI